MAGKIIFALDLGVKTGYAVGPRDTLPPKGKPPHSGAVILKKPNEPPGIAFGNLIHWLADMWERDFARPDLVVKEAPLQLRGFRTLESAQATVRLTYGLHGVVEGMATRFGIECTDVHDATIRKHFIGRGRMGTRQETKRAVIQRAQVLGYMPPDCADDDMADACALWDYASATVPKKLFLFGERAA
jgi:hypothetical protein